MIVGGVQLTWMKWVETPGMSEMLYRFHEIELEVTHVNKYIKIKRVYK